MSDDDYDPALDAYRSWEVAIEALRAKKEATDRQLAELVSDIKDDGCVY